MPIPWTCPAFSVGLWAHCPPLPTQTACAISGPLSARDAASMRELGRSDKYGAGRLETKAARRGVPTRLMRSPPQQLDNAAYAQGMRPTIGCRGWKDYTLEWVEHEAASARRARMAEHSCGDASSCTERWCHAGWPPGRPAGQVVGGAAERDWEIPMPADPHRDAPDAIQGYVALIGAI